MNVCAIEEVQQSSRENVASHKAGEVDDTESAGAEKDCVDPRVANCEDDCKIMFACTDGRPGAANNPCVPDNDENDPVLNQYLKDGFNKDPHQAEKGRRGSVGRRKRSGRPAKKTTGKRAIGTSVVAGNDTNPKVRLTMLVLDDECSSSVNSGRGDGYFRIDANAGQVEKQQVDDADGCYRGGDKVRDAGEESGAITLTVPVESPSVGIHVQGGGVSSGNGESAPIVVHCDGETSVGSGQEAKPSTSAESGQVDSTQPQKENTGTPADDEDDDDENYPDDEYEVEKIMDYKVDHDGKELFRVKWVGWHCRHNTWEPLEHLANAKVKIEEFIKVLDAKRANENKVAITEIAHKVRVLAQKGHDVQVKALPSGNLFGTYMVAVRPIRSAKQVRETAQKTLQALQENINAVCSIAAEPQNISIENCVDVELLPRHFRYITDYVAGPGVIITSDPPVGCKCADEDKQPCTAKSRNCCPSVAFDTRFAYTHHRKLRVGKGSAIVECNSTCSCARNPSQCENRVVQKGRTIPMTIFRTPYKGWGVRANCAVKKDTFVVEYVGEIITSMEAEKRGRAYDAQGSTYLFDCDFFDSDNLYTVDANYLGNVTRFINHSCDPNLIMFPVWINCLDPAMPRLAFFSKRDIARNEELTFSYVNEHSKQSKIPDYDEESNDAMECSQKSGASSDGKSKVRPQKCHCGTKKCRGYFF